MTEASRITVSVNSEGELEIFVNEAGRDRLVSELQRLDREHEHFHLMADELGEVDLQKVPYRPEDQLIEYAKVLFRPDDWDREYYPHVLSATAGPSA